jgi:site-specific DNA recombinase
LEAFRKVQEGGVVSHQEDRSTGTKLDRPVQAALDLARGGMVDMLLVYRVDRLSRKVRQLARLAEELDKLGVVLRSATQPFDPGSAAGRMMLQMLGMFAEFEHATIVDRVTARSERRAKEGRGTRAGHLRLHLLALDATRRHTRPHGSRVRRRR